MEFCIKNLVGENISSHLREETLDIEIRLKEKSATYKTFVTMNLSLKP